MRLFLISSVLLLSIGCAHTLQNATPQQTKLVGAIEVAKANDDLQRVTIALYDLAPAGTHITKDRADKIVKFTVSVAYTLQEVPNGWQPLVKTSWEQLKQLIGKVEPQLEVAWKVLDALVAAFTQ